MFHDISNTIHSDHIKELNSARPKQPFFFLKPPSSLLLPGAGPVLRPRGVTVHYEVELGLVIGKTLRDLHPEDTQGALDSIEGLIIPVLPPHRFLLVNASLTRESLPSRHRHDSTECAR